MNIARFEPWTFVDLLRRDLDRMADPRASVGANPDSAADWVPAVDIFEEKDRYMLRADVPGVDPNDINVSMDNGILNVSGERRAEDRAENAAAQRLERVSGRFFRQFSLPESTDAEAITARCSNGILEVSIPKLPEVQARRITVEAA
ncbi:MAG: Hsp20/alpha crystallin family protein [Gammaproteobacteria bacterium]|nr:Hsp20/alpha crystallin family protein [Gammaproteobacteria bacterium]